MDDRRMLELAAKAAGYELTWKTGYCKGGEFSGAFINEKDDAWNPRDNDGDAFRLAVRLRIEIEFWKNGVSASHDSLPPMAIVDASVIGAEAATRLAITRAAAAIQQAKEDA